jgi:hypothetical protein
VTFDQKVQQGLALQAAVETAKETNTPVEIAGVKVYPCDGYGRIDPRASVEYWPEPGSPEASDEAAHAVEGEFYSGQTHTIKTPWGDAPVSYSTHTTETPYGDAHVTTERRTRLYTAGCISGDDRPFEEKAAVFYDGAARLRGHGFDVVNPLDIGNDRCFHGADACHENTLRRLKGKDQGAGHSWECYLRHDLIEVLQCDGVALLPGWHESPGARMEFDVASRVGIPCKPLDEWLDPVLKASMIVAGDLQFTARTDSVCSLCNNEIRWMNGRWRDSIWSNVSDICPQSKDPDPVHVPAGRA